MAGTRTRHAVVAVALGVLIATGCSSDGDDTTTTSADTGTGDEAVGTAGCATTPAAAGTEEVHLDVDGVDRYYLRSVPTGWDGTTPVPVVMDIHGYAEGAELHSRISGFGELGEREGFVTVSPHGAGSPPHWLATPGSSDVDVIEAILDHVEATLCVDTTRVYVVGFSNGAFMASTLACELSDRIAAVAPVAGMRDVPGCAPTRPVPAITFHGTDDDYVVYEGGFGAAAQRLPAPDGSGRNMGDVGAASPENASIIPGSIDQRIPDITTAWATRNGCEIPAEESKLAEDVTVVDFACPENADVVLYRIEDGGHAWPGSEVSASLEAFMGRTTMSVSATETIWEFLSRHRLTDA